MPYEKTTINRLANIAGLFYEGKKMNISTVNELIQSLESAGELSIKERKYLEVAKACQQLAAENVGLRETVEAVRGVADNSSGIAGWHLNGDIAKWSDILPEIDDLEIPATDRIYAAQRSAFVDEAVAKITESGALTFGDCLVALCQLREVTK